MSDLRDVTIAVTSFLRLPYLRACLAAIHKYLPECQVIVADDSAPEGHYVSAHWDRTTYGTFRMASDMPFIRLPFDSGLSAKRNAIVKVCATPFLLMFCDDFKADEECRAGVLKMLERIRDWNVGPVRIIGGRVDNRPYEANLRYYAGDRIQEYRFDYAAWKAARGEDLPQVDLTANYFLARTDDIRHYPWPEECKIGGEHVCFFLDLKLAGARVWWMPGVNVKTMTLGPEAQDPRYPAYRARAYELGHQAMKRRYNIKRYVGMNGDVS